MSIGDADVNITFYCLSYTQYDGYDGRDWGIDWGTEGPITSCHQQTAHRHSVTVVLDNILILSVIAVFSLSYRSNEYYCIINSEMY